MLTILVLSVIYIGKCPKIIYPGKESFRILSDHFWEHVLLEKTHHKCHKAICEHKWFDTQPKLRRKWQNTPNRERQCQVLGAMCKHLQSTQVISYNIRISRPSNSSFNTLECHKNTTSHVTTHLSKLFAVDLENIFSPKINDAHNQWLQGRPVPLPLLLAQQWLAEEQPQQQASSVRKCFYFGNPKSYLKHMWHDGKHSKNFEKKKTDFDIKDEGTTGRPTVNQLQLQMLAPNQWWMVANVTAQSISCMLHIYSQHKSYHTNSISTYHILQIHPSTH